LEIKHLLLLKFLYPEITLLINDNYLFPATTINLSG
jgi:hypothetical protein